MIQGWLFKDYDDKAFGVYRISLYLTFFWFYHTFGILSYQSWLTPEFRSFYDPVSFFRIFNFDHLGVFASFDGILVWKVSLIASAIGFLFPLSSMVSFFGLLMIAGIPLNFGKIHHLNHLPVVILGIMAFSFHPGAFSVDQFVRKKLKLSSGKASKWALQAARAYMVLIYFESGAQKLMNTGLEWIFSDNMQVIILTRPTVTELGLWVAQSPWLCQLLAFTTVFAQLLSPLALVFPRSRLFFIPTLFFMHIGTYFILGNHGWFFPYNICYLVWLPWEKITAYSDRFLRRNYDLGH